MLMLKCWWSFSGDSFVSAAWGHNPNFILRLNFGFFYKEIIKWFYFNSVETFKMKFLKKKYERDIHFLCFIFFCFLLGAIKALVCLHIYAEKSQNIFFHLMRVYWYQIKVYLSFTLIKGLAKRTKSKQPSFWEIFAGIGNFMGKRQKAELINVNYVGILTVGPDIGCLFSICFVFYFPLNSVCLILLFGPFHK